MPSSSTGAVYSGSNVDNEPGVAAANTRAVQLAANPTYSMARFLEDGSKTSANDHLRPPVGLGQSQSEAEAEVRMQALLLAIDEKFEKGGGPAVENIRAN